MNTNMTIMVFDPEKMRALRISKGMTITGLAEEVGVSRISASMWESGTTMPCFESIQRLAHVFELSGIEPLLRERCNEIQKHVD